MSVTDLSPRAKTQSPEETAPAPAPQRPNRGPSTRGRPEAAEARAGPGMRARVPDDKERLTPYAVLAILAILLVCAAQAAEYGRGQIKVENGEEVFEFLDSPLGRYLRLFGTLCFVGTGAAWASMAMRGRLTGAVLFWLAALEGTCAVWLVALPGEDYRYLVWGTLSPAVYVMCLGIFLGSDDTLWPRLRKLSPIIAYGFGVLGIYYIWKEPWAGTGSSAQLPPTVFLQTTFWFGVFYLFQLPADRIRLQLISCLPIALAAIEAIYLKNRSWPCQCILAIAIRFLILNRAGGRGRSMRYVLALMAGLMLIAAVFFAAAAIFPEELAGLRERSLDDTRTEQYTSFFQQVPAKLARAGHGSALDLRFRQGFELPVVRQPASDDLMEVRGHCNVGYFMLVLWPGLKLLASAETDEEQGLGMTTLLWLLATLGLAIYHGVVQNPQNFLMILIAGRCYAILRDRRTQGA